MKKQETIALFLFILGLAIKLFKVPGHTIILALGVLFWLVFHITSVFKKRVVNNDWVLAYHLVGIATGLWLAYIFSVVKFLLLQQFLLGAALIFSIGAIAYAIHYRSKLQIQVGVFAIVLVLASSLNLFPKHTLYYTLNIKYNPKIHTDFRSLDKYSWFLTNAKVFEEALETNERAQKAAKKAVVSFGINHTVLEKLKTHRTNIQNKNWTKYQQPI